MDALTTAPPPDRLPADDPVRDPRQYHTPARLVGLGLLVAVGVVLCGVVAYPLLPALAWAAALAVIAFPVSNWVDRQTGSRTLAAGLATTLVVLLILVPLIAAGSRLAQEVLAAGSMAEQMPKPEQVDQVAAKVPGGPGAVEWARENVDFESGTRALAARFAGDAEALARGSLNMAIQVLVCVYVLFFALRDWRAMLAGIGRTSPLTDREADYLFGRAADSIHATVWATVVTSFVQGLTGGLLFWALGLPAPLVWGVVMFVVGVLPVLGAFIVWVPAAVYLAVNDHLGEAAILVAWGVLMAGPVCNFLYAKLAGGRMRMHPVPTLVAFVGGLAVFGISGIVLGPVILVVTLGLVDVWRRRFDPKAELVTASGRPMPLSA